VKLKAIIHPAEEGGYWAEGSALPGCVTQGETLAGVKTNLREAIEAWLSVETPEVKSSKGSCVVQVAV
jgi:predicted RNase H-like HicB family nuclease